MKVLFLFIMSFALLFAHKLNIFANEENGTLFIKSYFTKSSPCMQCDVKISQNNKPIMNAKTDDEGKIEYKLLDKSSNIDIEISAGAGHLGKSTFEFEKNTSIKPQIAQKEESQIPKILLALMALFGFFWILKRIKQK